MKEQCLCLQDSKKDDEVAVPVCVCGQEHERYCRTPPHLTPLETNDERAVPPVCAHGPERYCPHPAPPHPTSHWSWKSSACVCRTARKMMRLLCLCVYRNMNVIVSPHPTPPVTDHERAVPVSGQQERWWGCCACVWTGTWTLLSHPTPPHPTGNWWWKSSACVRTGTWTLLSHPTPLHR